jgi:PAS domain S-box-containing protein
VIAAFAAHQTLVHVFGMIVPPFIFVFPAVMVSAFLFGQGPGLLATALAVALVDYWVFEPIGHFGITHASDALALGLFSFMCIFVILVTERYRRSQRRVAVLERERALLETREQLLQVAESRRLALEAADLGAWDYHLDTGEVVWDERCRNEFGFTSGESLEYSEAIANIHPDDRNATDEAVRAAIAGENDGAYHREFRVIWPDRSVHWLSSHGRVYFDGQNGSRRANRFIGINTDITDRKRIETRLRRFYETDLFAILYWKINGGVVDVNDRFLKMTGYTREDVRAGVVNWAAMTPPEYHAADEEARRQIRETGVHQSYEKEYIRKDGTRVWGQFWAAAYEDDRNEGVSFILDISERKRAEEELRRAKREWERTFDSVPDLIAVLDNQHRIVRVNRSMAQRLGVQPDGCVGLPCYACVHGTASPIGPCPHTLTLRDHKEHVAEVHEDRLGGDFLVTTTPMFDENGAMDGTVHVARDITESKRAENELKESEKRYRNLFNAMNEGFCIVEMLFDRAGKPVDYRFVETNEAFERQTGLHDAKGKRMRELAPDHEDYWFEIYGRIALTGEPVHFMEEAAALGRWYDVYAYRVEAPDMRRVAIVFNDFSAYKRAEDALRAGEERLRLALDAGRMGTWDLNLLNGQFIWNDEMFLIMGYQPGSTTPSYEGWTRRVYPDDLAGAEERFRQSLESGDDLRSEYRVFGPNDEVRWVEARGQSERDANGKAVRSFGVVMDITERRRAEEAVRESEAQLRLALNANRAGMWAVDLQSGVRTLSPELQQLYGFEPGEFDGTQEGSTRPVIPEDRERVAAVMQAALRSGEFEADFRYKRSGSDEVRWMQSRGRVISDPKGQPARITGVNTDITQRKRAEEALRASEEKHRLLAESINDPFFAMDKDLRFTFWSQRTTDFNGVPAEVALGKTRLELFGESESQRKSDAMCRQCLETQKPVNYEVEWTFRGNRRLFDVQLFPYAGGVATIGRDITESRRAEEALRASEMRFRLALSNAPVSVAMQDRDLVFRWSYNQHIRAAGEIVGKTDAELFAQEEVPAILEIKRRVLETGQPEHLRQWVTSNGHRLYLDLYYEPTRDAAGVIDGIGIAAVDLTEQKLAEEAVKKSEEQFRTLANAIPQLSWMAEADGAITWYNDRWYDYTGTQPEQMEGWGWQTVHDPNALPAVMERWQASIATGSPFEMVFPLRGADGVFRPFLTRVMPLKDADGKVMRWFGTNTDISEQKQIEAELRRNEERLNLALEVAQLGEWERDLKGGTASRSLRHAQIFGYNTVDAEWNFKTFLGHVVPERRAEASEKLKSQQSGEVVDFETKIRRTDGEMRWIWVRSYTRTGENGQPMRAYGIVQDITARKQVEEQLQKLNRTLKALSNCSQALLHASDETAFLHAVCRIVTEDCGYVMVWIGFAENDEFKSVRPVAWSGFEDGYLQNFRLTWDESISGSGPTGTAIRTGQPSMCRNMLTDPAFAPWRAEATKRGYASSLVIPLKEGAQPLGAITIYSPVPDAFSEGEVNLLTELAGDLTFGIRTLRMRTAHAEAEAALRESEEQLGLFVEHAPVALAMFDTEMHYLRVSRRWKADYKMLNRDVTGLSHYEVFPEIPERWKANNRRGLAGEVLREEADLFERADGTAQWLRWEMRPWTDRDGNVGGILIFSEDITGRKLAEDALRDSQSKLQGIVGSAMDAVISVNEQQNIVVFNGAAEAIFKCPASEALGANLERFIPERNRAAHAGHILRFGEHGLTNRSVNSPAILTGLRSDGEEFPMEATISQVVAGGEHLYTVILRDITERKLAEDVLRGQAELLDLSHDTIMVCDLDGTIRFWNHGAEEMYGYTKEEATGRKSHQLLSTVFPEPMDQIKAQVVSKGRWEGELAHVTKDGTGMIVESRWVVQRNKDGNIRGVMEINSDITTRVKAEEAQRAAHLKLQSVLDSITDGLLVLDSDWHFTYCSEHGARILGLRPEDLVGARAWEVFPHAEASKFGEAYRRANASREPVHFEEFYPEPLNMWLECHCYPTDEGLSVYFRDISERKRTEEALLRSEKLASVGRMAATIAHEINNPLAAITNTLFLARMKAEEPTAVREFLDVAEDELKRITHITRQTLGFYRESSGPALMSVNAVMDSAVDLMKSKIGAKRAVIEKDWEGETKVSAIAGELRQVFANLLGNSLDAIDEGGTIRLRVTVGPDFKGGRSARVTVADNGKGVSANSRPHIFEPFFTTKGTVGTGLGLWVTKQIIDKHHGKIRLRSRTDSQHRGTVFMVILPAEPPGMAQTES